MSLTDFLLARIAEDEESALAAGGARWASLNRSWDDQPQRDIADVSRAEHPRLFTVPQDADEHVARWSPARVLAECEAKRRIVDAYIDTLAMIPKHVLGDGDEHPTVIAEEYEAHILPALALPYADHADFQEDWRV